MDKWMLEENQHFLHELSFDDGNIGFACGRYAVLDIDNPKLCQELGIEFPADSFVCKTGSGGFHLYFDIPGAKKVIIYAKDGTHIGELQCYGQYVVFPGSTHPNGNPYVCLTPESEIPTIGQEELLSRFRGICKLSDEVKPATKWVDTAPRRDDDPFAGVKVEDVFRMKVTEEANGQLLGVHPVHGSSTGHNLIIHPGKNVWQCRRCNSGGGAALAIAVMTGVIDCSDARSGVLRGSKFIETIEAARRKDYIAKLPTIESYDVELTIED